MPTVACPGSGRRIQLSFDDMRKTIVCAQCESYFNPVTGQRMEPPLRAGDEPEPSYEPVYTPRPRLGATPVVWAIFGMIAVFAVAVILVAVIKSGNNAPVVKAFGDILECH